MGFLLCFLYHQKQAFVVNVTPTGTLEWDCVMKSCAFTSFTDYSLKVYGGKDETKSWYDGFEV